MGYTHYFTQNRNFTRSEWETVSADLRTMLQYAQHDCGIALASGSGDGGTSPEFNADFISFNGVGDDSHETFLIRRKIKRTPDYPGEQNLSWDFCKTARKPYDAAVTACLCYLGSITRRDDPRTGAPLIGSEVFSTSSDGGGSDFLVGLDLARKALPRVANHADRSSAKNRGNSPMCASCSATVHRTEPCDAWSTSGVTRPASASSSRSRAVFSRSRAPTASPWELEVGNWEFSCEGLSIEA